MKYIIRFEACESLGNGGQIVGVFKTLNEAKKFRGKRDFNIFKSYYSVSSSGRKLRLKSEFIA